jgi:NAD(P)-dependent dehydrogenase (short-subunit alcohol dehydrogenase family)
LGPVPIQRPSGLRFAPDRGSTLLGALVVDVLKSGIYDIWAAVEAPYSLGCQVASSSRLLKFHAAKPRRNVPTKRRRVFGGRTKDPDMSNQVVLITGGLTGIGRAAAVAFAKKGSKVVVAGRRDEAGKALVKELRSFGSEAEFINADVRKEDDVRTLVDKTVARFGRLDVAVNNAGTEGQVGPITDQTAESYAATFDTNVLGVILSMKHEVRVMQGQGRGSIINISSTYGHEGAAGASIYVGSKHAVEGITKSVALEIAKSGIRVNGVAPGPTDTGMLTRFTGTPANKAALVSGVPMGRLGLSEELANAIVFIASDEASYITGHVLNVDGGHTAG